MDQLIYLIIKGIINLFTKNEKAREKKPMSYSDSPRTPTPPSTSQIMGNPLPPVRVNPLANLPMGMKHGNFRIGPKKQGVRGRKLSKKSIAPPQAAPAKQRAASLPPERAPAPKPLVKPPVT